jgi:thiosulfate dehydrogenase
MIDFAVPRQSVALAWCVLGCVLGACERTPASAAARERANDPPAAAAHASNTSVVPLRAPPESEIPSGPLGAAVRRGHAILAATRDSLPGYVGNALRCVSCHLDDGRRANGSPLIGVYSRYPTYNARSGRIYTIEDRINDCLRRSMNGRPLPADSRALRDITAYLAFLSRGVPAGATVEGQGLPKLQPLPADSTRGKAIFASTCTRCHGAVGEGTAVAPPLWGPRSYNIGAGMARIRTAASFVRHNMPYDRPGSLTDQQAFDVAAYIDSRPRPDLAGKENDWPNGDAPPDVAYPTRASKVKGGAPTRMK